MGKIKELEFSVDGLARTAIVEYKNASESVFRTTRRSVRKIAVLHREGDLELVQELNEAARRSGIHFLSKQTSGTDSAGAETLRNPLHENEK